MPSDRFRTLFSSLESEYCNLEARNSGLELENSALRELVASAPPRDALIFQSTSPGEEIDSHDEMVQVFRQDVIKASCDVEVLFPRQVFQRDSVHCMTPVVPLTLADPTGNSSSSGCSTGSPRLSSISRSGTEKSETDRAPRASGFSVGTMASSMVTAARKRPRVGLFPDEDLMKARVKMQVMNTAYDVSDFYKPSGPAQEIARHPMFEQITLLVIAINSIWIAVETDHNDAELLIDADVGFQVTENLFCLYFFLEIMIRFIAFDNKKNCFRDMWFFFDVCLVIMMVLETWVFLIMGMFSSFSIGNMSVLRIVRLFRLTRMARLARLLRAVPELMILIKGVAAAARSVFFTLVLLLVLLYIFGIAFTQLLKGTAAGAKRFPDVLESMNTLWLYATLLDNVTILAREIRESNVFVLFLLDVFILAASLTVMNMLIGVLCEVVNGIAVGEKESASLNFVKQRVENVFESLGINPDEHCISKTQFKTLIQNRDAARAINELGVDLAQLLDMADFIFESDEIDGDFNCLEKELTFEEFMDRVTDLRMHNLATVKDIMQLRKYIRSESAKALHHQEKNLDKNLHNVSIRHASMGERFSGAVSDPSSPSLVPGHVSSLHPMGHEASNESRPDSVEDAQADAASHANSGNKGSSMCRNVSVFSNAHQQQEEEKKEEDLTTSTSMSNSRAHRPKLVFD